MEHVCLKPMIVALVNWNHLQVRKKIVSEHSTKHFRFSERCAALGGLYRKNAPCGKACYGQTYCPDASGACVCPVNKIAQIEDHVLSWSPYKTVKVASCVSSQLACAATTAAPAV